MNQPSTWQVVDSGGSSATVSVTPPTQGSNVGEVGCSSCVVFVIKPNPGYTISRSSFFINYGDPANINGWMFTLFNDNNSTKTADYYSCWNRDANGNILPVGEYNSSLYPNPWIHVVDQVDFEELGTTSGDHVFPVPGLGTYVDSENSITGSDYELYSMIELVDGRNTDTSLPNLNRPVDLYSTSAYNPELPGTYSALDFIDNVVRVVIPCTFSGFDISANPNKNIVIPIYGTAMEIPSNAVESTTVNGQIIIG